MDKMVLDSIYVLEVNAVNSCSECRVWRVCEGRKKYKEKYSGVAPQYLSQTNYCPLTPKREYLRKELELQKLKESATK